MALNGTTGNCAFWVSIWMIWDVDWLGVSWVLGVGWIVVVYFCVGIGWWQRFLMAG